MKSVYCAVRTGSLNKAVCASYLKGIVMRTSVHRSPVTNSIQHTLHTRLLHQYYRRYAINALQVSQCRDYKQHSIKLPYSTLTLRSVVDNFRRLGSTSCHNMQSNCTLNLKMEAVCSTETSVTTYQSTGVHIPTDHNLFLTAVKTSNHTFCLYCVKLSPHCNLFQIPSILSISAFKYGQPFFTPMGRFQFTLYTHVHRLCTLH